jgi:hypothetical protein
VLCVFNLSEVANRPPTTAINPRHTTWPQLVGAPPERQRCLGNAEIHIEVGNPDIEVAVTVPVAASTLTALTERAKREGRKVESVIADAHHAAAVPVGGPAADRACKRADQRTEECEPAEVGDDEWCWARNQGKVLLITSGIADEKPMNEPKVPM